MTYFVWFESFSIYLDHFMAHDTIYLGKYSVCTLRQHAFYKCQSGQVSWQCCSSLCYIFTDLSVQLLYQLLKGECWNLYLQLWVCLPLLSVLWVSAPCIFPQFFIFSTYFIVKCNVHCVFWSFVNQCLNVYYMCTLEIMQVQLQTTAIKWVTLTFWFPSEYKSLFILYCNLFSVQ